MNQTVSEIKKRQEIGRGLRLAVNQQGERIFDDEINLLSVIANDSYQSYAAGLQSEYRETGDAAPPPPRNARTEPAQRNPAIYSAQAFRDFWAKLQRKTSYQIYVDTPALIEKCIERINNKRTPKAVIVVEKAAFVVTQFRLKLESVNGAKCRIRISRQDTAGAQMDFLNFFSENSDLSKDLNDERLRGFKISQIVDAGDESRVMFQNGEELTLFREETFQSEQGQSISERAVMTPHTSYPVPNLIDRAAKETGLTRPTINAIFKGLTEQKKSSIFANPEGFASIFLAEITNALAEHVADRIQFVVESPGVEWGYDLDDLFPPQKIIPQKELIDSGPAGLYDQTQTDSEVETRFVQHRLLEDDQVIFFFKFPPAFRIQMPRVIGNYNPDWGIARYSPDKKITLELVRETKGGEELDRLRFPHEIRKVKCAKKHFAAIGIDYRVLTDKAVEWWKSEEEAPYQERFEL